ncbi:MAG: hypothetical protein LBT99_03460 [Bifidobacteriaceae bacterium]|jgi:hypothetical protein|nr:hypothetical protein [Bifidobacteriaceae bacterium]
MKNIIKMNKTINYLLICLLGFCLVLGGTNASAYAHDKTLKETTWTLYSRDDHIEHWNSRIFNYPEDKINRKVKITMNYPAGDPAGQRGHSFTIYPVELTGSGSWDNYFDCNGNEVYSKLSACSIEIGPDETKTLIVKLGNSSWWKSRVGVYLKLIAPKNDYHYNAINYIMYAV